MRDIHFDSMSRIENPSIAKYQSVIPPTWDTLAPPFITLGPSVVCSVKPAPGMGAAVRRLPELAQRSGVRGGIKNRHSVA